MRERNRFLRGLVSFVGHKQEAIEFDRPFRKKGNSKSSIKFLIKYGFDAILSSTSGPAGLITKFGGLNSHMAIRCSELNLPALIGVGEKNFDSIIHYKMLRIACISKKITH